MAESVIRDYFPSQTVSDAEKASVEYGLQVGKAIQREWFNNAGGGGQNKYATNKNKFHKLRNYARGEQSIQIIPKFVDIVVNGISERTYDVKAYSQDPMGIEKRSKYMNDILADMAAKDFNKQVENNFGISVQRTAIQELPETTEELELHMQLSYKQN